jgi:hypothetical protein
VFQLISDNVRRLINKDNLLGYDAAELHEKVSRKRAKLAEKREVALRLSWITGSHRTFTRNRWEKEQERHYRSMEQSLPQRGLGKKGRKISTGNIDRV